jgi:hypothetical protein
MTKSVVALVLMAAIVAAAHIAPALGKDKDQQWKSGTSGVLFLPHQRQFSTNATMESEFRS